MRSRCWSRLPSCRGSVFAAAAGEGLLVGAAAAAFMLGLVNLLVRPLILLLTLPLGFFVTFVLGFVRQCPGAADHVLALLPAFQVDGFVAALDRRPRDGGRQHDPHRRADRRRRGLVLPGSGGAARQAAEAARRGRTRARDPDDGDRRAQLPPHEARARRRHDAHAQADDGRGRLRPVACGLRPAVADLGLPGRHHVRGQRRHPGLPVVRQGLGPR